MPRPLRAIAEGLIYHVINRGNGRQPVFFKDGDYLAFLKALGDLKQRKPFALYGYCLMANHIHLLLRPEGDTVSRIVQSLLVSHTQRFHRNRGTCGHVWQGRFRSPVIQDDDHLLCELRYLEANPLRAGIVKRAEDYRWSSFASHGQGRRDELVDRLATYEALAVRPVTRLRRWAAYVHQDPPEAELSAIRKSNQTGLPFGETAWVRRLAEYLDLDLTIRPRGRPRKRTGGPTAK
jgi:putative transposase